MTRIRNLDENGDWTFGQGIGNYLINDAGISLNIKTRLREWVSDCFFNLIAGIDYLNLLDYNTGNISEILQLQIKNTILQSNGVYSLESFEVLIEDRELIIKAHIKTINSTTIELNTSI